MSDLPPPPGPRWQPPGSPPPGPPTSGGMPLPEPTVPNPTVPNPTVPPPTGPPPTAPAPAADHPITLSPSEPPPGPKRSRLPAVVGALVAVALGAGVVVWLTRSGDDESSARDDSSSTTAASESSAPAPDTTVAATAAPDTTPATPPTTEAPLTLPSTIVPETTAPAETAPSLPVVGAPPGAIVYSDPAGWSISIDPAWQQSPDRTAWFTGTGSAEFQDNVNVAVEELATPRSLDDYVAAAIALIGAQATDLEIIDQRRVVGEDGVEVEVIGWTGSFAGLPRLSFVQAVTVTPTRAYIATFTSQPDRMAGLAPTVTPFLTTIRGA